MNKKLLAALLSLCCACAAAFGIAGCASTHEHTYSDEWKYDATYHWHEATCEHTDEVSGKAAHDTSGTDGACSVCGYKAAETPISHTHSWSAWTVSEQPTETATGKATRTCANDDCDAAEADKEYTLPVLTSSDYTKSADTATCEAAGYITYSYNKGGVEVSFDVATQATGHTYDVAVKGPDGLPFGGATVVLVDQDGNEVAEGTTGSDGSVAFANIASAEYEIQVWAEGGYEAEETLTTAFPYEDKVYTLQLAKTPAGAGTESSPQAIDLTSGTMRYVSRINWIADPEEASKITPEAKVVRIVNDGTDAATYVVSANSELGYFSHENRTPHAGLLSNGESFSVVLDAGESYIFTVTADVFDFDSQDKSLYPVAVFYTVSREAAPEKGSEDFAYLMTEGNNGVSATAKQGVYFKFDNPSLGLTDCLFKMTFDEELTVLCLGVTANGTGTKITSGTAFELSNWYPSYFLITSTSGSISFDIEKTDKEGSKSNPIAVVKDLAVTGTVESNAGLWYAVTNSAEEDQTYTFVANNTDTSVYVYEDGQTTSFTASATGGQSVWFTVPAGATYYLNVTHYNNSGEIAFLVRYFDAATDLGGESYDTPREITVGTTQDSISYNTENYSRYFVLKTTTPGYYTLSFEDLTDDKVLEYTVAVSFTGTHVSGGYVPPEEITLDDTLYLTEETVCITVINSKYAVEGDFKLVVTCVPLVAQEHTVTVEGDADVVGSLTVKIVQDGATVASAQTDAGGVATLSFIPGVYDIVIEGFDSAVYGYLPAQTEFAREGANFTVSLGALHAYKFTLVDPDGATVSGATVTLKNGGEIVAVGTTVDGVFTTGVIVSGAYTVTVDNFSDSYYFVGATTSATEYEQVLTLSAVSTVNLGSSSGSSSSPVELSVGKIIVSGNCLRYYYYQLSGAGTYTITVEDGKATTYGVSAVTLVDEGGNSTALMKSSTVTDDAEDVLVVDEANKISGYGYSVVTITLQEGETVNLQISGASSGTMTITVNAE